VWWDLVVSDSIITNFLLILKVNKIENWSMFDEVIRRTKKCAKFFGSSCKARTLI